MRLSDAAALAVVAMCAVAPVACVLVVALLRGYTVSLHMRRPPRVSRERRRGGRRGED